LATLASLLVVMGMNTTGLTAGAARANASLAGLGKVAKGTLGSVVPLAAAGAGIAVGVFAKRSLDAAIAFDESFTRIAAISNATAADISAWKEEVLSLAGETAKAPEELADALFFLSSAGLKANQIMPALEASAKAAASGLGETADVANIVASALNAYAGAGLTAASVTDTLVAAVREGRAEPEEFAGALGRILPIASQAGVTFDQVAASLASLSNIGLDVNEAVTAMRGVIQAIVAPGSMAADALKKIGLTAQDMLDAISEDGIIGALRMLDTAARENTDTQADYIGVLRQVVPNVRSLTGVLGLTGQKAEKVDAIFDRVLNSTGAMGDAFKTTAESDAFKLRKALNDLAIAGQRVASDALPAIVEGVQHAQDAAGLLSTGLLQLQGAFGFGPTLEEFQTTTLGLVGAWERGEISASDLDAALQDLSNRMFQQVEVSQAFEDIIGQQIAAEKELALVTEDYVRKATPVIAVNEEIEASAEKVGQSFSKAAKKIRDSLVEEIPAMIGTATTYKETFTLSPNELKKITESWARIARTIASDLETIAESDLKPKVRQAILALPPEMRNAWVEGNASQRNAIEKNIQETYKISDSIPKLAKQALTGGTTVGRQMAAGMAQGITSGSPAVTAAAEHAVLVAIAAARRAAAAESPSKKMRQLGRDLMKGLEQGIGKGLDGVISELQSAEGEWTKAWLRQAKTLQAHGDKMLREFDKLQSKVKDFRDTIKGAFDVDLVGGLLGLDPESGVTPAQYLADQVAAAKAFGRALKDLQAAGAGPNLLADLASQGFEALPLAQQLLADPALMEQLQAAFEQIAGFAPVGTLVEGAFGLALDRVAERALKFADKLEEFTKALRAEALAHEVDEIVTALRRLSNAMAGGGGPNTQPVPVGAGVFGAGSFAGVSGGPPVMNINITAGAFVHERDVGRVIAEKLIEYERRGGLHHQR
jgi:TP901 family phage tail tape measure protein